MHRNETNQQEKENAYVAVDTAQVEGHRWSRKRAWKRNTAPMGVS